MEQNKYLEKIAGFLNYLKPVGRTISDVAGGIGRQVHLATGGATRDYAAANFPIYKGNDLASANKLANMTKVDFAKNLKKSIPIGQGPNRMLERNLQFKKTMDNLQTTTNSARLNVGLMAGGTLIAGNSLLNHIGNNNNAYYQ